MHNLRGTLDNIRADTQWAELQHLKFPTIRDKGTVYMRFVDKLEWFYPTPKYLIYLKMIART